MLEGGTCLNKGVTIGVRADWPTKICQNRLTRKILEKQGSVIFSIQK